MNIIERSIAKVDAIQKRHRPLSFIFGVIKRYSDLNGSNLGVQLTYAMFTTVFPLLLLLVTVLTFILAGDSSLKQNILNSTFSQFPVIGSQLSENINALHRDSEIALVVGLLGLTYGCTALAGSGIYAMEQIWDIKAKLRLNYWKRLGRGIIFLLVLGLGVTLTTALSIIASLGQHNSWLRLVSVALALLVNSFIYLAAFRALTPKQVDTQDLVYGAIFGGVMWTILVSLGAYIVGHFLRNDNATYGVFGSVLGLMAWLYLAAQVTLYAAIINNVKKLHLWPRSIV